MNNNFSITIPKPCHEDWNKMTPDQKGAFCGSCQKSVYDFTGKSDAEIAGILEKNKGKKICGRFDASQLERPMEKNIPVYHLQQNNYSGLQAFAMALFLVFGSFLFNCENANAQKVGKVKVNENEYPVTGEMIARPVHQELKQDTSKAPQKYLPVMGLMKYVPPTTGKKDSLTVKKNHPVKIPVEKKPDHARMGDVCIMPVKGEIAIQKLPEAKKDTVKKQDPPLIKNSNPVKDTAQVLPKDIIM